MSHYDECREGYCGVCGQAEGHCEHTKAGNDMDIQLKPCPFCGHQGERKSIKPYRKIKGMQFYLAAIGCSHHGCTAQVTQAAADKETAWEYASALWNRRAESEG